MYITHGPGPGSREGREVRTPLQLAAHLALASVKLHIAVWNATLRSQAVEELLCLGVHLACQTAGAEPLVNTENGQKGSLGDRKSGTPNQRTSVTYLKRLGSNSVWSALLVYNCLLEGFCAPGCASYTNVSVAFGGVSWIWGYPAAKPHCK